MAHGVLDLPSLQILVGEDDGLISCGFQTRIQSPDRPWFRGVLVNLLPDRPRYRLAGRKIGFGVADGEMNTTFEDTLDDLDTFCSGELFYYCRTLVDRGYSRRAD